MMQFCELLLLHSTWGAEKANPSGKRHVFMGRDVFTLPKSDLVDWKSLSPGNYEYQCRGK